jgi:hypothetical protein
MSKFNLRRQEPIGEFRPVEKFTEAHLQRMYSIYQKYYENTRFDLFVRDFRKKTGAFLILHPKSRDIVGFSTVMNCDIRVGNKVHHAFFSGDTVIEKEFWGSRALQRSMYRYLLTMKAKHPFDPVYWMLISKGFKTYLLLANNYYSYWPHPDGECQDLKPLVEAYCEQYFGEYYDRQRGLLDFGDDYQPLKGEVAPITDEMRRKTAKIRFFEELNPTWEKGTELPCIGQITWSDILKYVQRFAAKPVSQGKTDAQQAVTARQSQAV